MAYQETTSVGRKPSINDLQHNHKYTNIIINTTTDIKDGAGRLHKIIVNGGTPGDITIYDEHGTGTTTKIGTITEEMIFKTEVFANNVLTYDLDFNTGLRITTEKATNLTVVWT